MDWSQGDNMKGIGMHGTIVGTDNDEDINHDPDYDPPGISEEELDFHEGLRTRKIVVPAKR